MTKSSIILLILTLFLTACGQRTSENINLDYVEIAKIQISAETQMLLSKRHKTSPRGEIQIKGHRPRATYLLEGHDQL